MKETYIQMSGIAITVLYGLFIIFLYAAEPRSIAEVPGRARSTVESIATTGQVIAGMYKIDQAKFDEGLTAFRQDNFLVARDRFDKADPEKRDAATQFYVAYSFYRQGWGRVSSDDVLFRQALEAVERSRSLDQNYRSEDPRLLLRTPDELRSEIEEGLQVTAEDFNPLKVFRDRK